MNLVLYLFGECRVSKDNKNFVHWYIFVNGLLTVCSKSATLSGTSFYVLFTYTITVQASLMEVIA